MHLARKADKRAFGLLYFCFQILLHASLVVNVLTIRKWEGILIGERFIAHLTIKL